ncbi:IAP-1 [Parapoynx stagnalis nucleopolyhedrovirus]|uniref:IAP-1 n=1 Tax=Parapoynx stagnalis nucleopolyhedrovirus TaxID=2993413 RepID=A0A9E7YE43_9ABAC|nr:IAP-1 [Parapoynx stagnalis nucleopolyhedrovirus]
MEVLPVYVVNVCESIHNNDFDHTLSLLMNRFNSFENYPIQDVAMRNNFVINGFKHNHVDDHVVCEYCHVEIKNWSVEDCIEYVHCKFSPYCSYANKLAKLEHFDDSVFTETELVTESKPECIYKCMSNTRSRINTFTEYWPITFKNMIEKIADAGLFYTGKGDETVCFFCDCKIRDWHHDDEPWRRHVAENPQCFFVVSVKGKNYNGECQKNQHDNIRDITQHETKNVGVIESEGRLECTICLERQRDAVLLPCRHFSICVRCYFSLDKKCPSCRQDITDFIKVFVA